MTKVLFVSVCSLLLLACAKKEQDTTPENATPRTEIGSQDVSPEHKPTDMGNDPAAGKATATQPKIDTKPDVNVIAVRFVTSTATIQGDMGAAFGKLTAFAKANGLKVIAPPMAFYYNHDTTKLDTEALLVVDKPATATKDVSARLIKSQRGVSLIHMGPYSALNVTYKKGLDFIKLKGLTYLGVAVEIYLNDPTKTKPADLKTEVFLPVT